MIFLTVGTERWPFDRLISIIDSAIKKKEINGDVFGQIGRATAAPHLFKYDRMLAFDKFMEMINRAEIVISHAGVGSTILCLRAGKIPILFPRRASFGEHLNDHQADLARKMEESGRVLVAHSEADLIDKVKNFKKYVANLKPVTTFDGRDKLTAYLNDLANKTDD